MSDCFLIGTAARFDKMKRLDRLIEALGRLPNRERFQLIIAGDGDHGYRKYLCGIIDRLGLGNKVHLLGFRDDVRDIVGALDLFVLPSCEEPFGLALLEAMALGVPCAVFADGGGLVDIMGDGGLVAKGVDDMARMIARVEADVAFREEIQGHVCKRARCFDIENVVGEHYQVYTS